MPVQPTYPGVYIEELPSGVRTITGVATSITGFVGKALRGPTDQPVTITDAHTKVSAVGLELNSETRILKLLSSVRGTYHESGRTGGSRR